MGDGVRHFFRARSGRNLVQFATREFCSCSTLRPITGRVSQLAHTTIPSWGCNEGEASQRGGREGVTGRQIDLHRFPFSPHVGPFPEGVVAPTGQGGGIEPFLWTRRVGLFLLPLSATSECCGRGGSFIRGEVMWSCCCEYNDECLPASEKGGRVSHRSGLNFKRASLFSHITI